MDKKQYIREEDLEVVNGGSLTPQKLNALKQQILNSTELEIDFLIYMLFLAKNFSAYACLYVEVEARLQVLGYEIKVNGVFFGEAAVWLFVDLPPLPTSMQPLVLE